MPAATCRTAASSKSSDENAALKAGIQILLSNPASPAARRTVEDQLRELGEHMGFDFLLVSAPNGTPLAGVIRHTDDAQPQPARSSRHYAVSTTLAPASSSSTAAPCRSPPSPSIRTTATSVPSPSASIFTFSGLASPAVLLHNGQGHRLQHPEHSARIAFLLSFAGCGDRVRVRSAPPGRQLDLRALCSPGMAAIACAASPTSMPLPLPFRSRLRHLFLSLVLICFAIVFLASILSARSIVEPISAVVSHLQKAASTGVLAQLRRPAVSDPRNPRAFRHL